MGATPEWRTGRSPSPVPSGREEVYPLRRKKGILRFVRVGAFLQCYRRRRIFYCAPFFLERVVRRQFCEAGSSGQGGGLGFYGFLSWACALFKTSAFQTLRWAFPNPQNIFQTSSSQTLGWASPVPTLLACLGCERNFAVTENTPPRKASETNFFPKHFQVLWPVS